MIQLKEMAKIGTIICIIWCALEPVVKRHIRKRKQKKYGKMKH